MYAELAKRVCVAGHKRQACLHEVERLRVEGRVRPQGANTEQLNETGHLVISHITIPLKRDTLRAMAAGTHSYRTTWSSILME